MKRIIICLCVLFACGAVTHGQTTRNAIRKADQDWLKVFAAKDLAKSVDFVLEDGSVLAPNVPIATGHDAISKLFAGFFGLPDLKIEWTPNNVQVARSGDIGYSTGVYRMSFKDPNGKTIEDKGKYLTVWKRQGRNWRVAYDIFNSDLSPTP